jgi:hypothetical protein
MIENLMEIPELTMCSADTDSFHQFFKIVPEKPLFPAKSA